MPSARRSRIKDDLYILTGILGRLSHEVCLRNVICEKFNRSKCFNRKEGRLSCSKSNTTWKKWPVGPSVTHSPISLYKNSLRRNTLANITDLCMTHLHVHTGTGTGCPRSDYRKIFTSITVDTINQILNSIICS